MPTKQDSQMDKSKKSDHVKSRNMILNLIQKYQRRNEQRRTSSSSACHVNCGYNELGDAAQNDVDYDSCSASAAGGDSALQGRNESRTRPLLGLRLQCCWFC